jgi:hypothetical protein
MVYCMAADVRLIVSTSLTDTEVSGIIEMSDAEIDRRIGVQSSSDKLVKKLSMLLTAHAVKTRQPKALVVGEYREDSDNVLEVWEKEIERIYRLHGGVSVEASEYRHIDEDTRYPREALDAAE